MKGTIVNFRGSRRIKKGNQMIVQPEGVDDKEKAKALVGKTVTWTAPGKKKTTITGKISAVHGNKGTVRAVFERGLPGQALGQEVKIE
ncbi:50S ribosomal protein L35ae [Candidatus Woesearchaeota archaeon]|nr:50S ribosomal protein L35ae [Candidatus Woesearchaeota archaeon]